MRHLRKVLMTCLSRSNLVRSRTLLYRPIDTMHNASTCGSYRHPSIHIKSISATPFYSCDIEYGGGYQQQQPVYIQQGPPQKQGGSGGGCCAACCGVLAGL